MNERDTRFITTMVIITSMRVILFGLTAYCITKFGDSCEANPIFLFLYTNGIAVFIVAAYCIGVIVGLHYLMKYNKVLGKVCILYLFLFELLNLINDILATLQLEV